MDGVSREVNDMLNSRLIASNLIHPRVVTLVWILKENDFISSPWEKDS